MGCQHSQQRFGRPGEDAIDEPLPRRTASRQSVSLLDTQTALDNEDDLLVDDATDDEDGLLSETCEHDLIIRDLC